MERTPAVNAALRIADLHLAKDALMATKVRALIEAYAHHWSDSEYHIAGVERTVTAPLWNFRIVRRRSHSRTFSLAGKLDVTAYDQQDKRVIIDHKTTGDEIHTPDPIYYRQQQVERQWLQYIALERENNRHVDYVVLNVLRKPAIKPSQIDKQPRTQLLNTRIYYGRPVSGESLAYAQEYGREDLELYEARLAYDAGVERPHWYFRRFTLTLLDHQLEDYYAELWQDGQEIRNERLQELHTPNSRACLMYGTPCQFLNLCTTDPKTWDLQGWKHRNNVHEELPGLTDSRNYLTNTRIGVYKLCHRKHDFLYNIGIERQEPSEARDFGTLWHECLKKYYEVKQSEQAIEKEKNNDEQSRHTQTSGDTHANIESVDWI